MGLFNGNEKAYYQGNDYGGYQFVSIPDVINNFMISHVGQNKIINKVDRTDIAFHAQRALQELSYDTLKSVKSQEIEVCGNLKMPLPHDYVNYVKLTRVDSAGIEHIIYPTSKTSNPFSIEQTQGDCVDCGDSSGSYQYGKDINGVTFGNLLSPQEISCSAGDETCTFTSTDDFVGGNAIYQAFQANGSLGSKNKAFQLDYWTRWTQSIDTYCQCLDNTGAEDNCGEFLGWTSFLSSQGIDKYAQGRPNYNIAAVINNHSGWSNFQYAQSGQQTIDGNTMYNGTWPEITTEVIRSVESSNAWDNYKSATPSENQDDYQDDTYWPMNGERYGLDPQHAHANGSFFIDDLRGIIHFSSNVSGKTIILKYISDSLGTDDEMVVHKFAEEAIYKWIAYAVLSTKINTPEHIVQRFKKEKFAETRKAKLRLSNIKLEEITQTLRGKSKQIKH